MASSVAAMSMLAWAARATAAVSPVATTCANASAPKRKPLPVAEYTGSNGMLLAVPRRTRSSLGR